MILQILQIRARAHSHARDAVPEFPMILLNLTVDHDFSTVDLRGLHNIPLAGHG